MLRLHLAQLFYAPAYFDSPVDYLEEPYTVSDPASAIGTLRSSQKIESFLIDMKSSYLTHIGSKLSTITTWSAVRRHADILVFPEYSVPVQLLPALRQLAMANNIVIIAGSHRVRPGEHATHIYTELGPNAHNLLLGSAIIPILHPNGTVDIVHKITKSKWEPNLAIPDLRTPLIVDISRDGRTIKVAVVPCIDSLHLSVIGQVFNGIPPDLIVVPSMSPTTTPFASVGTLAALSDTPYCYINAAQYGGTFFNVPSHWTPYLSGSATGYAECVPATTEAVLEVDIEVERFFIKTGSIVSIPPCSRPRTTAIVYGSSSPWLLAYLKLRDELVEWLTLSQRETALDWLDSYLTDNLSLLPEEVDNTLRYVRHTLLPLYDGNAETIAAAMDLVVLEAPLNDTRQLWAQRVNDAIHILRTLLTDEDFVQTPDGLLTCLASIVRQQKSLPKPADVSARPVEITGDISKVFTGAVNLVHAFQNRGPELDWIKNFLDNNDYRILFITGPLGIGKTDFLNVLFQKSLTDWQPMRIQVPSRATVPRLIGDIAYAVGVPLDIDSLGAASHNVFKDKVRRVLAAFFSKQKRILIVDDLAEILKTAGAREQRQLATFMEESASPPQFIGGRVFVVTSVWVPDTWLRTRGASEMRLKVLRDRYTRRIIEYYLRLGGLVSGETPPELPQSLLDIVAGHPLSARLVVDTIRGRSIEALREELVDITGRVAQELLKRVDLSAEEAHLMRVLSVFRLPVRGDDFPYKEFEISKAEVYDLAKRAVLDFDGKVFSMHEAVRRFYSDQISAVAAKELHKKAAQYYKEIFDSTDNRSLRDPSVLAERAHHLALSGDLTAGRYRALVIEELKPVARLLYREQRNYEDALSLYQLISELVPDDADVLAYLGRCHARLAQWADSDEAFKKAIRVATRTGSAWWIYRDWGHIRARYRFYSEAMIHLAKAESLHGNDASIQASRAFMYWRQGEAVKADELFHDALESNPYHEYTLTYYPKVLVEIGEYQRAEELRERLNNLKEVQRPRPEYDLDVDSEDL